MKELMYFYDEVGSPYSDVDDPIDVNQYINCWQGGYYKNERTRFQG